MSVVTQKEYNMLVALLGREIALVLVSIRFGYDDNSREKAAEFLTKKATSA